MPAAARRTHRDSPASSPRSGDKPRVDARSRLEGYAQQLRDAIDRFSAPCLTVHGPAHNPYHLKNAVDVLVELCRAHTAFKDTLDAKLVADADMLMVSLLGNRCHALRLPTHYEHQHILAAEWFADMRYALVSAGPSDEAAAAFKSALLRRCTADVVRHYDLAFSSADLPDLVRGDLDTLILAQSEAPHIFSGADHDVVQECKRALQGNDDRPAHMVADYLAKHKLLPLGDIAWPAPDTVDDTERRIHKELVHCYSYEEALGKLVRSKVDEEDFERLIAQTDVHYIYLAALVNALHTGEADPANLRLPLWAARDLDLFCLYSMPDAHWYTAGLVERRREQSQSTYWPELARWWITRGRWLVFPAADASSALEDSCAFKLSRIAGTGIRLASLAQLQLDSSWPAEGGAGLDAVRALIPTS